MRLIRRRGHDYLHRPHHAPILKRRHEDPLARGDVIGDLAKERFRFTLRKRRHEADRSAAIHAVFQHLRQLADECSSAGGIQPPNFNHRNDDETRRSKDPAVLYSIVPTRILGVIPARFASSRFPGKALAVIAGKPMLQHVYERASQARYLSRLVVATDDERIEEAARSFGAPVRMTRADHASGTDRVAEVASADSAEIVVNIQGDEPLIDPAAIDAAALALVHNNEVQMSTLRR